MKLIIFGQLNFGWQLEMPLLSIVSFRQCEFKIINCFETLFVINVVVFGNGCLLHDII